MKDKLWNLLTGFKKSYSTQHYLMCMIERWKETLNKVGYVCVIFMDTLCTSGCNLEDILKKTNKVLL